MKVNYNNNPRDSKSYDTSRLREEFLTEDMFKDNQIVSVYSHIDRIVVLGISPKDTQLVLNDAIDNKAFGVEHFLQRREFGLVNLGGRAQVTAGTETYTIDHLDGLYLGMGTDNLIFRSLDTNQPALLYCISAPAHHSYPSRIILRSEANIIELGSLINANERVIRQYLHPNVLPTCQLSMGVTSLREGSVWNTMPAHTHERRMEAYFYFDIKPKQVVFHLMGEPTETRHVVLRNHQMILSPSWSIHSGCGTQNYSFIWGMLGENQTFDDMDFVDMDVIQ
ncbi:5-dehydro-4-deoxy-D-glucuronate isomerase [Vibrio breoganii]|uniref:5-dehydro-4-deoxy-D-glucuronate isomerase n=1 Tax=Vibrio breoganii TaxID=553239 RepID=UPI000C84DB83|nr:5-dehydro-4-deoxy-D-glucuronate isomerase [Vibrio breoganii]PML40394.1 5-dehydro-4-deoxy-D-glucuronate isomerase [Vibrio breoganii]PML60262.1 5-dehydro-4-deoxy-D-glucuronate isomerase [Vibrio breoganii]PMO78477.1 5-dehydro-4-deoxy-D-glucuronate isomerase [Vibrio breoganii]